MKKKIIALILAVVCAFSVFAMVGCGGSSDHEFVILAVKDDTVEDYNNMPVFQELNEVTGKDVYWRFQTTSQYNNNVDKLGTRGIDAIYHAGFSNLDLYKYGHRNRIVAIDEYLNVMPNFKRILETRPDIAEALKSPDGHIYSLPRIEELGLKQYPNILFINKKWIEKLIDDGNMPEGVTLAKTDLVDGLDLSRDEFKAILQKFAATDFDNDGKTTKAGGGKEIPLSFVYDNWQGNISDLISSFGVAENLDHKTIIDGKITFTVEDEKWFNALQEIRNWYADNLIDPKAFDTDQDSFLAFGQDGRYGAFYWWEKETVVNKNLRDDYIIVKPLKNTDGERYVGVSNTLEVEKSICVILSSCKDKEGLLSYFDKFFEPDFSAQINYGSIKSGAFLAEKQDGMLIPNDDHGEQSADDFRMRNAPYGVVYLTDEVWGKTVKMESRAQLRKERLASYVTPYSYKGAQAIPNLNYTEQELNDLNTHEMTYSANVSTFMVNCITKGGYTKANWENLINSQCKASIAAIKKINQDGYDRYLEAIK